MGVPSPKDPSYPLLPSSSAGLWSPSSDRLASGQPALLSLSFPIWMDSLPGHFLACYEDGLHREGAGYQSLLQATSNMLLCLTQLGPEALFLEAPHPPPPWPTSPPAASSALHCTAHPSSCLAPSPVLTAQLSSIQHPQLPARAEPDREQARPAQLLKSHQSQPTPASHLPKGHPLQPRSLLLLPTALTSKSPPTCSGLSSPNYFLGCNGGRGSVGQGGRGQQDGPPT